MKALFVDTLLVCGFGSLAAAGWFYSTIAGLSATGVLLVLMAIVIHLQTSQTSEEPKE